MSGWFGPSTSGRHGLADIAGHSMFDAETDDVISAM